MPNPYSLPGFQVEPEAAFWLEGPNRLSVARIQDVEALTAPGAMFAIDPAADFPDTPTELLTQFIELLLLSVLRDKPLRVDDPAKPGTPIPKVLSAKGAPLANVLSNASDVFSTDQDADQAAALAEKLGSLLPEHVHAQILASSIDMKRLSAKALAQFGAAQAQAATGVAELTSAASLSQSVAQLSRLFPARVSPVSAFLQLQPAPFGAIINVARLASQPASQTNIADVRTQDQRIATIPPTVILTGRELARAFENETPGIYHRHALNWLLFNRPDVSPPRHARVWAALDMAIYSALGAAWHYKWQRVPYRYLQRPWEYSSILDVLFDREVNSTGSGDGATRTCPAPSPGTPRHPAWPSGHATYSAAASYVLEYFFAGEASLGRSYEQVLQAARGKPLYGPDWIALHLRLLANNIAEARLFGGVHWRGDSTAGQKIGRAAARVIIDQLKADCVPDFVLRNCPDGAGVVPPDPDALATATRAARATTCLIDQDLIERRP